MEKERIRLASAIEQADEGVAIFNTKWEIEYVDQALQTLSGLKKQDLINKILETQAAKADKPKQIGPSFVGDDKDIAAMATADEILPVEDPEPPAPVDDEDDDGDILFGMIVNGAIGVNGITVS